MLRFCDSSSDLKFSLWDFDSLNFHVLYSDCYDSNRLRLTVLWFTGLQLTESWCIGLQCMGFDWRDSVWRDNVCRQSHTQNSNFIGSDWGRSQKCPKATILRLYFLWTFSKAHSTKVEMTNGVGILWNRPFLNGLEASNVYSNIVKARWHCWAFRPTFTRAKSDLFWKKKAAKTL